MTDTTCKPYSSLELLKVSETKTAHIILFKITIKIAIFKCFLIQIDFKSEQNKYIQAFKSEFSYYTAYVDN